MVFDNEKGGYTEDAGNLHDEFSNKVRELILKYMNTNNMTIEEIAYVTGNAVEKICLRNILETRANKNKK